MQYLDETHVLEMVYGGAVLGAGGGGSIQAGLAAGRDALALGAPRLIEITDLAPEAIIATLSIVGSVSAMSGPQSRFPHSRSLRGLAEMGPEPPRAVIASEVGPQAVTYGWQESAATGIPIVDAPCNGRAHPLGVMGSLGLHRHPRHTTTTVATSGDRNGRTEMMIRSSAATASTIVRKASAGIGVPLAVARNPLPASYVARHAAIGALTYTRRIGRIVVDELGRGLTGMLRRLADETGGRVVAEGEVRDASLCDRGGFTVGCIRLEERAGNGSLVDVCNEYLALRAEGAPRVMFPDLIALFDRETRLPLSSPEVRPGMQVCAFVVPSDRLILGSTMQDKSLLRPLKRLLRSEPKTPLQVRRTSVVSRRRH